MVQVTNDPRKIWLAISELQAVPSVVYTTSYLVSALPSAATAGGLIYVSDETGGATMAFSDGTNWRRVQDRAIVS
jgi:hypothetical protein